MKKLILLRHAKAEADSPAGDFGRSLSERGRQAATRMGAEIRELGVDFDLVLASPARRVAETVSGLGQMSPTFDQRIYNATCEQLLDLVRSVDDKVRSLLIVGHNPGMALLTILLTSDLRIMTDGFPTGALAEIELAIDRWDEAAHDKGRLTRFIDPKKLD